MTGKILFIVALVVIFSISALANDTIFVFVGSPLGANDTIDVEINDWLDIPVYFSAGSENIYAADICYPLG